jgi:hypothetical protein
MASKTRSNWKAFSKSITPTRFIGILVLALSLPVTVSLVNNFTLNSSKASGTPTPTFFITPTVRPTGPTPILTPGPTYTPPTYNYIINGKFDYDDNKDGNPDYWTSAPNAKLTNEASCSFAPALRFYSTSDTSEKVKQNIKNITPGSTYTFYSCIFIPTPLTDFDFSFKFSIDWLDVNKKQIKSDTVQTFRGSTGAIYVRKSYVAPANTVSADIRMSSQNMSTKVYVDDLSFTKQ